MRFCLSQGTAWIEMCVKHNAEAYSTVKDMLEKVGKAAVIHPTGTGKSFIGFKLCEDHPDKKICWVSPSRYIYDTQLENLAESSGGYKPDNTEKGNHVAGEC